MHVSIFVPCHCPNGRSFRLARRKLRIGSYFTNYWKTITHQVEIFQEKLSTIVIFISCNVLCKYVNILVFRSDQCCPGALMNIIQVCAIRDTVFLSITVNILSVPDCVDGYFGAGCKMQCHCAGDAVCDKGHGNAQMVVSVHQLHRRKLSKVRTKLSMLHRASGGNCQGKNKTINVSVNNPMLYPNAN